MSTETAPTEQKSVAKSSLKYDAGGEVATKKTGNGSGYVLAVAILQLVGALFLFGVSRSNGVQGFQATLTLIFMLVLSAVFFGLWFWAKRSPFPALLTTLVLFVGVHALDAIFDPMTIMRGLIIKIAIIAGLTTAMIKAYRKQQESEVT